MATRQYKHLLISYKDPTGGRTWSILEPGLKSKFPIKELFWSGYVVKQLEITFVDSSDMPAQPSVPVEDLHNVPLVKMLILDGDDDSRDSKTESRKLSNDWAEKNGDEPWLIIVVQRSSHQGKIFKYQLAEKIKSDIQAQYRNRICSIKVNEGQNEDQWVELMSRIKELIVMALDGRVTRINKESNKDSDLEQKNFPNYYKAQECLANLYAKVNLFDLALSQYIEIEKGFYEYMKRTKREDTCFSGSKFSDTSSSRIIGGDDIEYGNLDTGNISSFDFHQYIVSQQFNLLLKLSMPELALMRTSSFITAAHNYITTQVNIDNPMIVDGWIFNAALAVSNTCNFYISCTKSDTSQGESYLRIAEMFLEARNELKRFGISRGLLDKSFSTVFGMLKAAFAIVDRDFDNDDEEDDEGDDAKKDGKIEGSLHSEYVTIDEPFTIKESATEYNPYLGEPDTEYISNALSNFMATAHQNAKLGSTSSVSSTNLQDKSQGQQPMQSLSTSKRMTQSFKARVSHTPDSYRGIELQKSASPTVSGDEQMKSIRRTTTFSPTTGPIHSPQSLSASLPPAPSTPAPMSPSATFYRNHEMNEMLAIEQFYGSIPSPAKLSEEELSRFSDNPILMESLRSVEAFDPILIGLSEKAQKAYNMAKRPRASLNLFCDVALFYFIRNKWTEAEGLLSLVTDSLRRWKLMDNAFLILLCYAQYKNKNYAGFVNTCFKILGSADFGNDEEKRKYVARVHKAARNKLAANNDAAKRKVIVGENVKYECKIENKLPCDFCADKIEMVFRSSNGSKAKFKAGIYANKGEEIHLTPGKENNFTFTGVSSAAGTFELNHYAITIGKLIIKRKYKGEQAISITVLTTPPKATFIATFPKWLPKDKTQEPHNINFIIRSNTDKLSNIEIVFNTDSLFKESKLTDREGTDFEIGKGNTVKIDKVIDSEKELVLSAPIDYTKLKKFNEVSAKLNFCTPLSGGVCNFTQKGDIRWSDPFTFTSWQAPFRGDSILVQVQLQSKAAVPLKIVACKVAPAGSSTALEGPIFSLGTEGKPLESVYRIEDGFVAAEDGGTVIMPKRLFGTAYVFQKPPKFTETWNFSVKYEFAPFPSVAAGGSDDPSIGETLTRAFTSQFNMGFFSPEYTATLLFPKTVTIGEMFNMLIRVNSSSSSSSSSSSESDDVTCKMQGKEEEEEEEEEENRVTKKKVMALRVSLPVPGQYVQQGFSKRVVEFEAGREQTFRVGFIPLQMGELAVPTVEITDVDSEFNKARVLPEHPAVHSLSSSQFFLSCERVAGVRPLSRMKMSARDARPFNVIWVHTPAGTERVKEPDCAQKIASAVNKLQGQQITLDIAHYVYKDWVQCRGTVMEEKCFHTIIVDGDSRLVSRVLLFVKQREKYLDTPIAIYTDDMQRAWSEFSQVPNVHAIYSNDQLFDILTENPFVKRGASENGGALGSSRSGVSGGNSGSGFSNNNNNNGAINGNEGRLFHRHTKSISFIKPSSSKKI